VSTCPTCGGEVWLYAPGLYRCVNDHLSLDGQPDNTGRTLTPIDPPPVWRRLALAYLLGAATATAVLIPILGG
jgi:hypothetical protein